MASYGLSQELCTLRSSLTAAEQKKRLDKSLIISTALLCGCKGTKQRATKSEREKAMPPKHSLSAKSNATALGCSTVRTIGHSALRLFGNSAATSFAKKLERKQRKKRAQLWRSHTYTHTCINRWQLLTTCCCWTEAALRIYQKASYALTEKKYKDASVDVGVAAVAPLRIKVKRQREIKVISVFLIWMVIRALTQAPVESS